jgi:hypothetical protein
MTSPVLRWTTFVLFVAVLVTATYLAWTNNSEFHALSTSASAFDDRAGSLTGSVMELRMSQQAYVAAGQGDEFWGSKVATQVAAVREELGALRTLAALPEAQGEIDEALAALADFERMDARAREYARGNQRLLASDLIFSDGLEKTTNILKAVAAARTAEAERVDGVGKAARQRELLLAGGTAVAALGLGLLLVPAARPLPGPTPDHRIVTPAPSTSAAAVEQGSLMLRDVRDPLPPPLAETPASMRDAPMQPLDPLDLGQVAALCTELARIVDTRSLQNVLERTATVLDANGIVLWIADPDGRELNPIVTHGYPSQLITRLGTIPRDAENATAAAFRTSLLQTVDADSISNGAIAAPLVSPGGCVGVMAAEVRHGGERHDTKLATAAIVAAQLATLVGPPSVRSQSRPEAARA